MLHSHSSNCIICHQPFQQKGANKRRKCAPCRNKLSRKTCPKCKGWMSKDASQCHQCAKRFGPDNHNWKGGKPKHRKGYLLVRCLDHPKAKANNGYILEHILVMEKYLGRYLLPGENVHHKNGIKDDNRLENLELWTTNQPNGCRVTDVVGWAVQILERYNPEMLSQKPL